MAGRNFLFVPGPTNVPDRVLRAMVVAMEDHRSPIFPELASRLPERIEADLQDQQRQRRSSSRPPAPVAGKRRSPTA